jgi:hypothetical protein
VALSGSEGVNYKHDDLFQFLNKVSENLEKTFQVVINPPPQLFTEDKSNPMSIEKLVKQNIRIGRLLSGCAASLFFVN